MAISTGNPRQLLGANRIESILADFGFAAARAGLGILHRTLSGVSA
jgi:hypothetical protein